LGKLSFWIDLYGVGLADKDLTWLHAMPVGTKKHPEYGELEFTSERLQRFASNVKNKVRKIDLDIDYEHKQDAAKGNKAAGWIKDAEVRTDGLWLAAEFTETAQKEIKDGEWKYLSPEFNDEWTDADGNKYEDVLFGAALTNRPFLKDLLPIAASEDYVEKLKADSTQLHDGYFKINDRVRQVDGNKVGVIKEIGGRAYGVKWDGSSDTTRWVVDGDLAPETPGQGGMLYSELENLLTKTLSFVAEKRGASSGV
jgi:hypothetical protein